MLRTKFNVKMIYKFLFILLAVGFSNLKLEAQFTEQLSGSFPNYAFGNAIFGDYNNDGLFDVLTFGDDGTNYFTKLYRNTGSGFVEVYSGTFIGIAGAGLWCDFNNDGLLDIVITGREYSGTYATHFYKNTGTGFSEVYQGTVWGGGGGNIVCGDYNNDGKVDLALGGTDGAIYVTKLYKNTGNGFLEDYAGTLTGLTNSYFEWGDYDGDGKLDLLCTGQSTTASYVTKLYHNNGNGFTEVTTSLPGVNRGFVKWGDYDNDGDLDILIGGRTSGSPITKVFRNDGGGVFTELTTTSLFGLDYSKGIWADYNNDGLLDIFVTGYVSGITYTKVYQNTGSGFTEIAINLLKGKCYGYVNAGDYDNDGDLDIILIGSEGDGTSRKIQLYRNTLNTNPASWTANTAPTAPSGLLSTVTNNKVLLKWQRSTDNSTPAKALTYNIRVGSAPGKSDIVGPMACDTATKPNFGFRRVVTMGNNQLDTSIVLSNLKKGTCYWSVQALDNNFAGGVFSSEQSFVYTYEVQSSLLRFSNVYSTSLKLQWNRGNGEKCAVFVKENGTDNAIPADNSTYLANAALGSGSQIGSSGWYCVYNGSNDTITISNLKISTNYRFQVVEYTGAAGSEKYFTAAGTNNPVSQYTNLFIDQNIAITGVSHSTAIWGDYNNDGYLDFLLTGYNSSNNPVSKIYKNNGNNTFTEQTSITITGVRDGSVAWGDYNNDGYLDILITGYSTNGYVSKIYKNNGNNTFTEQTSISLTAVGYGSAAWGDYNNDGLLDILLTGYSGSSYISKIYKNNGDNSFTEQASNSLVGVEYGSVAWGDYDNDGYLDILLTGYSSSYGYTSKIYKNNGNNTFTEQTSISLTGVQNSSVAWGDYNNDGYLDIFLTGYSSSGYVSKIYKNNGNNTFTEQTSISLAGLYYSSVSVGDYNNDGLLDILLAGYTGSSYVSKIYRNNGSNNFVEESSNLLTGVSYGSVAWGDYDNDGDLDILLTGNTGSTYISKIYRNDIGTVNTPPASPTSLVSAMNGTDMVLRWNPVKTDGTSYKAMCYNVKVGTTSGGSEIASPQASSSGYRRIPAMGNGQLDTTFVLHNIKKGTYYWSAQAVDNSLAGGAFSGEQQFVYNVDVQSFLLGFSNINATSLKLQWNRGNGDKCVVFASENGTGTTAPGNNTTYTANTIYGQGTQIGTSGWYCVYNGSKDSITISNLKVNTNYRFQVIEYTGAPGSETYYTVTGTNNPISQYTNLFSDQNFPLAGLNYGSVAWGDYNNDGYMDMLITGYQYSTYSYISKIYKNNGNNTFTEQTSISLANVENSSVAWGDYDNDGYLDILLTGYSSSTYVSKIYKNNAGVSFTEQTSISLTGVQDGSVAWGDYNNDGYLDIILTGYSSSGRISKIYKNKGNNTFVEQTSISLTGVNQSSVAWGDYNNDGLLDILLTGYTGSSNISKIYKNNGDESFTEQTSISLTGVRYSSVAWGDYNNDGYLDILLTGYTSSYTPVSKIYKNNGDNSFTEQTSISLTGIETGSVAWGDYDNDGNLDILLTGNNGSTQITKIYRNNGDNTFTELSTLTLPGTDYNSVSMGDYDNDGDLDLFLIGRNGTSYISKLYKNEVVNLNNAPVAPSGLVTTFNGSNIVFGWNPVKTDATSYKAISYNVKVGSASGTSNIVSPQAASSGYRRISAVGNGQLDTTFMLKNMKKGTYYWSVQAVDNSYVGGAFASEQSFVYNADVQSYSLGFTIVNATSAKLQWSRGNGDKCVVFAMENGTGNATPVNNTTYTALAAFNQGTQIGTSGWYCVYNGVLDTVTVTNLKANTEYRFQVIEYSGVAGSELYYTTTGIKNPNQYMPPFTEQTSVSLTGISGSVEAWADYNNDGFLDLFIAGNDGSSSVAKLYKNNGDGTFTIVSTTTFDISGTIYDAKWCDYDNDGDMDLLIAGLPSSKLYDNNGDGTFTLKTSLSSTFMGKCAWADMDNDGFKDIIMTGSGDTKILKNNHDGTFTAQSNTLPSVANYSSVACGDYDSDGDADILVAGYDSNSSAEVTKVFRNDGNFVFTEQTGIVLPGISNCSVAWADMDGDGDLDIVISGAAYNFYNKIYENKGSNTFAEMTTAIFKQLYRSSMAIGDYDNDGYPDILMSGSYSGSDYFTTLYKNNGNKTFTEVKEIVFDGVQSGSAQFGDFDKDGDLDLFLCGLSASGRITKIFKNNSSTTNIAPSAPSGLTTTLNGNNIVLKWNKATDDKTLQNGLSYNIYLYETSKSGYRKGPSAFNQSNVLNGLRLIASFGDIQYNANGYIINGLPIGNYKWSIQAVDAGLKGSPFATEIAFSILDLSGVAVNVASGQLTGTSNSMQYSINSTDGSTGTWISCGSPYATVNYGAGGFDVWVRQSSNNLNNRKVATISASAAAPAFTINYTAETTTEAIADTVLYSTVASMSSTLTGSGSKVSVTPGQNLYFRVKATTTKVASAIQTLTVAVRPATPVYAVDYINETTSAIVPVTDEYSSTSGMASVTDGIGAKITLIPGQNLYFRTKATGNAFKSLVQTLTVSNRPAAPTYTADDINKTTNENIPSTVEYSTNADMSNAQSGAGTTIAIAPGQSIYLRNKATATSFKSQIQTLSVSSVIPAFTEKLTGTFPNYTFGFVIWGDYNNDGLLDVLACGDDGSNYYTKLFQNTGSGFIETYAGTFVGVAGVCAWSDFNNDGLLDIIVSGREYTGTYATHLYKNTGSGFTEVYQGTVWGAGAIALGDYNKDGLVDIIVGGDDGLDYKTKVYKNTGNGFVEEFAGFFTGLSASFYEWGDYDNDGDLDLLCTGQSKTSTYVTKLYRNDGNTFTEVNAGLTAINRGFVRWADYDNDGDLDILIGGRTSGSPITKIYRNNGGVFTELTSVSLMGLDYSRGIWADYNNDGLLDIFVTGLSGSTTYTKVYQNTGTGFTEVATNLIKGKCYGFVSAGDYDNDGDMDLILSGSEGDGSNRKIQLYRNNAINSGSSWTANTAPGTISNLATTQKSTSGSTKDVTFTWDKASDTQTSQNGLSYNLYIYQEGQNNFVLPPHSFIQTNVNNGLRLVSQIGNIQFNQNGYTVKGLPKGNYKWSVQAIDAGLKGGNFAPEASFTITSTGISSLKEAGINFYPNPVIDMLTIEGISEKSTVSIYTMEGKLIKAVDLHNEIERMDLSDLQQGIYILKITNQKKNAETKFLKQ